jgi:hypothetical protein
MQMLAVLPWPLASATRQPSCPAQQVALTPTQIASSTIVASYTFDHLGPACHPCSSAR